MGHQLPCVSLSIHDPVLHYLEVGPRIGFQALKGKPYPYSFGLSALGKLGMIEIHSQLQIIVCMPYTILRKGGKPNV